MGVGGHGGGEEEEGGRERADFQMSTAVRSPGGDGGASMTQTRSLLQQPAAQQTGGCFLFLFHIFIPRTAFIPTRRSKSGWAVKGWNGICRLKLAVKRGGLKARDNETHRSEPEARMKLD